MPNQPSDVLSPEALAAWARAAEQATPGPWYSDLYRVSRGRGAAIQPIVTAGFDNDARNAAYIALCSPERVRSLIAAYTASVAEVERLRALVIADEKRAFDARTDRTVKRWTEVLCQQCGGNGVVKIHHGTMECPRCDGRCYEPENAPPWKAEAR